MAQVQAPAGGGEPPPDEGDWSQQVNQHATDYWNATLDAWRAAAMLDSIR